MSAPFRIPEGQYSFHRVDAILRDWRKQLLALSIPANGGGASVRGPGFVNGSIPPNQAKADTLINTSTETLRAGLFYGYSRLGLQRATTDIYYDASNILVLTTDQTSALRASGAGNVTMFSADNDTITIGFQAKFEQIQVKLDTAASADIVATFEYSTGVGAWTSFSPTDGTTGFTSSGSITWNQPTIPSWAVGTGNRYLIRITRTVNALVTAPIVDTIQLRASSIVNGDYPVMVRPEAWSSGPVPPGDGFDMPVVGRVQLAPGQTLTFPADWDDRRLFLNNDVRQAGMLVTSFSSPPTKKFHVANAVSNLAADGSCLAVIHPIPGS